MPICKLCLKEKELRKSHIVPLFMQKDYFDSAQGHFLQHSEVGKLVDNALNGSVENLKEKKLVQRKVDDIYDLNILCGTCEQIIGDYETYAAGSHFLDLSIECEYFKKEDKTLTISGLDYAKYKLFYLSILWRMSITTQPAFQYVDLGKKYNEVLRKMIFYGNPKKYYHFPILSSHFFNDKGFPHKLYLSPIQYDSKQYSMVHLLLNGYVHNFIVSDTIPKSKFNPSFLIRQNGCITIREMNDGDAINTAMNMQFGR